MGLAVKPDRVRILALDSSSKSSNVALCESATVVAESSVNTRATHSQILLEQIDTLLRRAAWQLADLDLLAVVCGPGAFTGLRIGIATIKGLAQVLGLPVVTVSSLQAVAMNLPLSPVPVCAFLDARKQEVYCQIFEWRDNLPVPVDSARVMPPGKMLQQIRGEVVMVGDGVPVFQEEIARQLAGRVQLAPDCCHRIQASRVAWLALQSYHRGLFGTAAEVVPTYVRPSDAELNSKAQQCASPPGLVLTFQG